MELSEMTDVAQILRNWEDDHTQPNYDPEPTLTRLVCFNCLDELLNIMKLNISCFFKTCRDN